MSNDTPTTLERDPRWEGVQASIRESMYSERFVEIDIQIRVFSTVYAAERLVGVVYRVKRASINNVLDYAVTMLDQELEKIAPLSSESV